MQQHILYYRDYCGYCARVEAVIQKLAIDVERRNIWDDDASYSELTKATGRGSVPVLRIIDGAGESRWMPESADIAAYLTEQFKA